MRKTVNIITTTLLVLILLLAFALVGIRLFGIAPYTVLSGSMEPTYHVGSLIYVKKVDVQSLQKGDPLTYVIEGGTVVTHRIVEVLPDYGEDGSPGFRTKGDNNAVEDGTPVHARNVLGKPLFTIPLLGYFAYYVQNPPWSFLAIGFCLVIVLMTFLPDLMDKLIAEEPPGEAQKGTQDVTDDASPPIQPSACDPVGNGRPPGGKDEHPPNHEGDEGPPPTSADAAE